MLRQFLDARSSGGKFRGFGFHLGAEIPAICRSGLRLGFEGH